MYKCENDFTSIFIIHNFGMLFKEIHLTLRITQNIMALYKILI